MNTVTFKCGYCKTKLERPKKEVTRQQKKGRSIFFCNLSCAASYGNHNTPRGTTKHLDPANRKDLYTPFRYYLRNAKRRKHKCDLTLEYLKTLWEDQAGRCAFIGIPLSHPGQTTNPVYQASLDRIDSNNGYVMGNVQYVCLPLNLAKNNLANEHIAELVALIRNV